MNSTFPRAKACLTAGSTVEVSPFNLVHHAIRKTRGDFRSLEWALELNASFSELLMNCRKHGIRPNALLPKRLVRALLVGIEPGDVKFVR